MWIVEEIHQSVLIMGNEVMLSTHSRLVSELDDAAPSLTVLDAHWSKNLLYGSFVDFLFACFLL